MKSKIFSTDQIHAIQDGRMTQFMQVVKQPLDHKCFKGTVDGYVPSTDYEWSEQNLKNGELYCGMCGAFAMMPIKCPFEKVGGVIAVREHYHQSYNTKTRSWDYIFKSDLGLYIDEDGPVKWRSPATMPREAARLFLRITNIRVMRVQELTEKDAIKQGYGGICECKNPVIAGACEDCYNTGYNYPPLLDLKENNEAIWNANQWIWTIDFTKTDKP